MLLDRSCDVVIDVIVANHTLVGQDWKKGGKMMGKVRPYDPVPPPQEKVTTSDFPLKLAKMTVDGSKKGIEKYVITLSNEIRSMHLDHPVHGGVWRDLIVDFDKKLLDQKDN